MERQLSAELNSHPWQDKIKVLNTVDSTNTYAKAMARQGAPHGTVVLAKEQRAGRGRLGRSFSSPKGKGIYCSVVLRPAGTPEQLLHLTPMMAEATRRAISESTGLTPSVKWVNDLVLENKKLCGILTELDALPERTNFVVVGIGINCDQCKKDFPAELQDTAISLSMATGRPIDRVKVISALIRQISIAADSLLSPADWMAGYRAHCITLHREVQLIRGEEIRPAYAEDVDDAGGLVVRFADGSRQTVTMGEVSVRGLYGYV